MFVFQISFFFKEKGFNPSAVVISLPKSPVDREETPIFNSSEYFDPKERSKERKKNVEMNKTDDKRSNAMAALKAKREGKQRREEEEAKRLAEREGNDDLDSGNTKPLHQDNFFKYSSTHILVCWTDKSFNVIR